MKQDILDRLNEIIVDEKGYAITINDKFIDSNLDSLGSMITIVTLEAEYPFFKDLPEGTDELESLDIPNLTIRELLKKCKLSIINTSPEPTGSPAT